ncbi:MAG TPA: hypothetical protein ENI65_01645 [Gammaproteobacteria bacterium]|nr:hypothetical protein [Gammaproteobacteria bacterium]
MDAAVEPPWMVCFACLDLAYRFCVRIDQISPKRTCRLHFNYIRYMLTGQVVEAHDNVRTWNR